MGKILPEGGLDRMLQRPSAYTAGSALTDGQPYDAGSLILAQTEASHLCAQSDRVLVESLGPGADVRVVAAAADVWSGIDGLVAPAGGGPASVIPWDRRTARRFAVTHAIEDYTDANGDPLPRPIEWRAYVTADAALTTCALYCAATFSPSPRAVSVVSSNSVAAGTTAWASGQLAFDQRAPHPRRMRSRRSADNGGEASVAPMWIWFGWLLVGPGVGTTRLHSFSAWEAR